LATTELDLLTGKKGIAEAHFLLGERYLRTRNPDLAIPCFATASSYGYVPAKNRMRTMELSEDERETSLSENDRDTLDNARTDKDVWSDFGT
jgi:hypothetical protein